jgi:hypothetical protein
MKNIKNTAICLLLAGFSASVFADTVTITGAPITLEKRGEEYYVPDTYKPGAQYNYVTIGETKRVCYLDKQPNIKLDPVTLNVRVGQETAIWTCYDSDPKYFTVPQ